MLDKKKRKKNVKSKNSLAFNDNGCIQKRNRSLSAQWVLVS